MFAHHLAAALTVALALFGPLAAGCAVDRGSVSDTAGTADADSDAAAPIPGEDGYVEGDAYGDDYYCCAEGAFPGCCEGFKQGLCFQYGGVTGDCAAAGEYVEGKDICAHCCQGLDRVSPSEPDADSCVEPAPPSLFVCVACGDGVCGAGENRCTCPADCSE